jgi:alkanesulfonate monooxygenase SsuD/methylene tetrahydromethanopterin reductase-like flavin-dependent oxidoreductase (luciferase family)
VSPSVKRSILYQVGGDESPDLASLVAQVQLAEQLGIETVWCFPAAGDEGRLDGSAPELWLATLAEHTERIRLGWGRAGLLPPRRPPLRVAEQAASLDVASAGRLELGLVPEDATLAADADADWQEGYRMLVGMWDARKFSWQSARFALQPIDVVPKPVQRPHPPLWLAGWSEPHARAAGRGGLGYLDLSGAVDGMLEVARDAYLAGRSEADPDDLVSVEAFAAVAAFAPGDEARERLRTWEGLGLDRAVARIGHEAGGHEAAMATIRFLATAVGEIH